MLHTYSGDTPAAMAALARLKMRMAEAQGKGGASLTPAQVLMMAQVRMARGVGGSWEAPRWEGSCWEGLHLTGAVMGEIVLAGSLVTGCARRVELLYGIPRQRSAGLPL